ncbi:glycosyl hydrolase family 28-related protein [Zoogloea sp.]|uniref:glycosyl hydrolase family 28-related protein n=3 Tax=Zoogloea sp. TaxID=49181 RepID=UPI0035AF1078
MPTLDTIDWIKTYSDPPAIYRALREACAPAPSCQGVSALDYGADPSGLRDSSPALNAAIAAAAGRPVILPAGKFRLDAPLRFSPTGSAHVPGLTLLGAGQHLTILQVRHSQGAAILLDQTPDRSYRFGQYGMLAGFTLEGMNVASGPAIRVSGAWRYQLEDLTVRYFKGNAIEVPWRGDIHTNPDAWQTTLRMSRVTLDYNQGWGVYSEAATGFLLNADDLMVRLNGAGGLNLTGSARIVGGAIAWNYGPGVVIRKQQPSGANPQISILERIEFDGNTDAHLKVEASARLAVRSSRFISQPISGVFKPLRAVVIGNNNPGPEGAVTGVTFDQCAFRATMGYAWTGFSFLHRGSYSGITIDMPLWITYDPSLQRKYGPEMVPSLVTLRE